jgi:Na+/proline symporter
MMGAATSGYEHDMLMMLGEPFGSALALLLSGLFFARLYRRTRRLTWIEFFEARYGRLAAVFGALADITSSIIWIGGILFTFGVLTEALTGLPMAVGVFGHRDLHDGRRHVGSRNNRLYTDRDSDSRPVHSVVRRTG